MSALSGLLSWNLKLLGAVFSHPIASGFANAIDGVEEVHLAAKGGHVDNEAFLVLCHDSEKNVIVR